MMKNTFLRAVVLFGLAQISGFSFQLSTATAQVTAHMKLWDRKYRYPRVNSIEFKGDVPSLASYDAVYGHGAMWENEWIGFRVYMDHRQSIDLYGKKQARMELDETNFYTTDQQWAEGYGEDILFVGGSIGAGSFRGYVDEAPVFVNPVKARGQRVLKEGPDTAIVEIYADDWQYQGHCLQFRQRFTAIRGHREVQVDVFLEEQGARCKKQERCFGQEECPAKASSQSSVLNSQSSILNPQSSILFATGVQKFEYSTSVLMQSDGLVASWGSNIPDKEGHPDRIHTLGMAVRVAPENLVKVKEDELNLLCIVRPVHGHIRYWLAVASDLQQQGGFHSANEWFKWAQEMK